MSKTVNVGLVQMNSKLGDVEEREGSDYKVFNTKLGKIGIIICYNAGFPEVCRTLALERADMVFIPAAWRIQDEYMWDLNLAQRALGNVLFTIGVNRVGIEENLHLSAFKLHP